MCFSFSFLHPHLVLTSGCFMFYTSVPLLVFIATEEDYHRVVETPGYHILLSLASVDANKDEV